MNDEQRPDVPHGTPAADAAECSRRQWLLRLGEFVALAGVSGLIPDLTAPLAWAQAAHRLDLAALPPGLYEPSQEHLVHALSSAGKAWTPPSGSETEYAQPGQGRFHPQFFTEGEFLVATRFIEILLGMVDAPAASQAAQWFDLYLSSASGVRSAAQRLDPMHRALAVAYYGEDSVRELETVDPQAIARSGLRALGEMSLKSYGHEFLQLSDAQQLELLSSASKAQPASKLRELFDLTRTEAIRGYYTTAAGIRELDYRGNAYYSESPGCDEKS